MSWLLQAAPDATAIVTTAGLIVTTNAQFMELFGYADDELIGQSVDQLVPQRFRDRHVDRRSAYAEDPVPRPMGIGRSLSAVRGDGSEFAAEISLSSFHVADGILISVAVRDVSERRKDEERFRQFVEHAPDAVVIAQADGTIVLVNVQTERLFGYQRDELLGAKVEILMPERLQAVHPQHRAGYAAAPKVRSMGQGLELHGRRKNGSEFPVEISLSPLQTDGEVLFSSAIRDLSERHKIEQVRSQLAAIVDSSEDAIIGSTLDGQITSWNRSAEEIFGYREAEAIDRPLSMLLPEGHENDLDATMTQLRDGVRVTVHDAVRRCADGREIDVSISMSPIRDGAGNLVGASKVVRDIADRKRQENDLAAAKEAAEEASAAFEAFSYSVAHDLRAPLRAIDGFSEALASEYGSLLDDAGRDYLHRVRGSAQRMSALIDSLLSLASVTHRELGWEMVDLSALVRAGVHRLRQESPERDVVVEIQPDLMTHGDPILLSNALDNLLSNAWKFTARRTGARIEFGLDGEGYFVRDNGAGFDMACSAKLFGVFQRLHQPSEYVGTGIGLATVQRIVQRHGGRIWAEGIPDSGATFHFTLESRAS